MITMPPTISPIRGRAVPTVVITCRVFSNAISAVADVSIAKSSGSIGRRCRKPRKNSRTCSIESFMSSSDAD